MELNLFNKCENLNGADGIGAERNVLMASNTKAYSDRWTLMVLQITSMIISRSTIPSNVLQRSWKEAQQQGNSIAWRVSNASRSQK